MMVDHWTFKQHKTVLKWQWKLGNVCEIQNERQHELAAELQHKNQLDAFMTYEIEGMVSPMLT